MITEQTLLMKIMGRDGKFQDSCQMNVLLRAIIITCDRGKQQILTVQKLEMCLT